MTTQTVETRRAPERRAKRPKRETSIVFATVVRKEQFRPNVIRVTLQSAEFEGFICDVPDQFITFIFPLAGSDPLQPAVSRDFGWDDLFGMPAEQQPHARNYTVRAFRRDSGEVDVDMILHDGYSKGTDWAICCQPGHALAIWGPRVAYDPPPKCTWQLLVADDTGLPAVAAILVSLPESIQVVVFVEVDGLDDRQDLPTQADATVTWLYRNGQKPGTARLLETAVRDVELPNGVLYGWGGGEFREMSAIGKYLRRERGFRPSDVSTIGYW